MNRKLSVVIFSFLLLCFSSISNAVIFKISDVEVGFSPGHSAIQIILNAIEKSRNSISVAAYSFTSKPIALALINAQERGVNVRLVVDKKSNTGKYTAVTYLVNHFVPVRLNNRYTIMHNKFMIIDDKSVETGSFNYTKNATSHNAENVIYIKNRIDVARKYSKEFDRLWDEGKDAKPTY
ncbi:endonuclease (plasmid) [Candidatus Pantoea edessiphila]|uniref:phospholipase D n=1 Tax=Candidatus Pantoea edessiphila TaxID=2044610 RepID=A0A2P5SXA5_9GAMM|nr:phospholipase D family protein [Candidatus Pantoea edessiphila]MBK4775938.1 phospholipase D family protein [Pantoea sp. Edef]PPI86943.1 endonuclease [Candidatus Pantoea edessiphila]